MTTLGNGWHMESEEEEIKENGCFWFKATLGPVLFIDIKDY